MRAGVSLSRDEIPFCSPRDENKTILSRGENQIAMAKFSEAGRLNPG